MIKEVWIDHAQWNDLPWRFEPGTPPIADAVGLHAAVEYLGKLGMGAGERPRAGADRGDHGGAGAHSRRLALRPSNPEMKGAVVAFNVDGIHPHDGAALLDQHGIAVRAGHHCAQPLMKCLGIAGTLAGELLGLQHARRRAAPGGRGGHDARRALAPASRRPS